MNAAMVAMQGDFAPAVRNLGWQAAQLLLLVTGLLLLPLAVAGVITDFLQVGPVLAFEKLKPKLENLNPVDGVKRMFSMDNLVEVLKAVLKTALLFAIGWAVLRSLLPALVLLVRQPLDGPPAARLVGGALWMVSWRLAAWTIAVFAGLAVLDAAWQRHSYIKKLRMSRRDIRQETKENEGDPHIKAQRRQTHQEWSQRNAAQAARDANVLVVNPTHIAIAIEYDRETCPVPTVSAQGEDEVARAMREAAEEAGVPVVRNVELARELLAVTEPGEVVPQHLFEIVAEVILWAREVREEIERQRRGEEAPEAARARRARVPGEDLTRYPADR
jgi:flagellar biosynthesis protein FlhB